MAYIYEHIRTQGFEPIYFEQHFSRLDALARKLFLAPIAIGHSELKRMISEHLRHEGYSPNRMNAVCVRYHNDGRVEIIIEEMLYKHFDLRALRPQGHIVRLASNSLIENTSAKVAMLDLDKSMTPSIDKSVPIWVDATGEVVAIEGSTTVAVFDDEIRISQWANCVEADIVQRVLVTRNRKIVRGAIMEADLATANEIFFIDYRGVTALRKYENHLFADIIAEKAAKQVALSEQ